MGECERRGGFVFIIALNFQEEIYERNALIHLSTNIYIEVSRHLLSTYPKGYQQLNETFESEITLAVMLRIAF